MTVTLLNYFDVKSWDVKYREINEGGHVARQELEPATAWIVLQLFVFACHVGTGWILEHSSGSTSLFLHLR